ncbi:MAG: mandelate racemase/muconate lactonizing enzyme family protein [Gemmataceae bacterium]|nr:mandelate racemase/muconate lactonizing enzyme family protein [Gemmataceae bacterium]
MGIETLMHITRIRTCQPPCDSPKDWRTSLGQILVAAETDVGLTGYGVGGGGLSAMHIVRTVLRDLLVGREVEPIATRWQEMYDATLAFGRKGVAVMAISGVDLALWDLRAKAAGVSVAQLLGGPRHATLPTYATVWGDLSATMVGTHSAFKLHLGKQLSGDVQPLVDVVRRARDRVGLSVKLMVDAWMKWDVPFTLRFADAVVNLGLDWIEEPISPDDLAGYAELCKHSPIPIAGGEHEFTALAFNALIERRLHHVLQPDVCWVGGMTELVKIYTAANQAGVRVCPHRGAEVWALPALAALDSQPLAESGRPWLTWVGGQPPICDGVIEVPSVIGFGATFAAEVLAMLE